MNLLQGMGRPAHGLIVTEMRVDPRSRAALLSLVAQAASLC
jgi:hypothetical protein